MILPLGYLTERVKQLAAIYQIKDLRKFSLGQNWLKTINEMFCNQEFVCQK